MTAPQAEIDVQKLGRVLRIEYVRKGKTYVHEFTTPVDMSTTHDRRHLVIHGGSFEVDKQGWLHG